MADKLKKGIAVIPTFSDGEAVRAGKLTAMSRQLARGLENVEQAVGDIYDESYPYSTDHDTGLSMVWGRARLDGAYLTDSRRSLDIVSLGRLIGPAANLNPHFPMGERTVVQTVPAGVRAFVLKYPLSSIVEADDDALVNEVETPSDLPTAPFKGFCYVSRTNEIICNSDTSGGTITYITVPEEYSSGENYTGATFNVIPDPIQIDEGGDGCTVSASLDSEGRHTITLPEISHMARNENGSDVLLTTVDPANGLQLVLPPVLTETYVAGEVIPTGFLYLKNHTTGQSYRTATYTYINSTSLYVSGIDLEAEVAAGNEFVIVTVGTDITTSVDDLRKKMRSHSHSGDYGEEHIEARHIAGWTRKAGVSGVFVPSTMEGNYAPQYLHRDGKRNDASLNDDNAMRGDIWFGKTGSIPGQYLSVPGATYGVVFGGSDWAINRNGDDDLLIRAEAGKKVKVYGADVLQVHSAIDKKGANEGEHTIIEENVFGYSDQVQDIECGFLFSSSYGLGAHRVTGIFDGLFIGQTVEATGGSRFTPWVLDQHAGGWDDNVGQEFSTNPGTFANSTSPSGVDNYFWKVPKINILHMAQERFNSIVFYDGSGALSTSWSTTDWAQVSLGLPSGFSGKDVLGISILVRRDNTVPWYSTGGLWAIGAEHPLRSIGFRIHTDDDIEIYIPTDGITDGHPFHYSNWKGTDANGDDPHSSDFAKLDVKITLILAGQTRTGIANMVS